VQASAAKLLRGVFREHCDRAWNQAGLMRGRECACPDRTISRAGGLGEGAQARLSEVAIFTGCSSFFAQSSVCSEPLTLTTRRDHRVLQAGFKGCQRGKLSKFRPEQISRKLRIVIPSCVTLPGLATPVENYSQGLRACRLRSAWRLPCFPQPGRGRRPLRRVLRRSSSV
jgi:hypothetical protein